MQIMSNYQRMQYLIELMIHNINIVFQTYSGIITNAFFLF